MIFRLQRKLLTIQWSKLGTDIYFLEENQRMLVLFFVLQEWYVFGTVFGYKKS